MGTPKVPAYVMSLMSAQQYARFVCFSVVTCRTACLSRHRLINVLTDWTGMCIVTAGPRFAMRLSDNPPPTTMRATMHSMLIAERMPTTSTAAWMAALAAAAGNRALAMAWMVELISAVVLQGAQTAAPVSEPAVADARTARDTTSTS